MRTGTQNENVKALITALRKESSSVKNAFWDRIADDLEKSARNRREVNLSKLSRYSKPNETIIVPGKVLGAGTINHTVVVAALNFSASARAQIEKNGKAITIQELIKQNPKGKDVRIIG